MAVNPNQSYLETLREMRTTRMQQLRQGNSQAQIMNRQMSALTSMNNSLSRQLQAMNRLDMSQRASNQQLMSVNRNLTSLSTTLSRSIGNLATSIARGTGAGMRAAGGAVVGTVGAAAGATGSLASSIASGVGKVLPVAIAGYVTKSLTWDNMSQETQDKLTGSVGNLFQSALEGVDSTELGHSLTQALTPAFDQLKVLSKKLGEEIDAVKKKIPSASEAKDTVINKANEVKEKAKSTKDELGFYTDVGKRTVKELSQAELPDIGLQEVALGTASLGLGKLVYDANKGKNGKELPSKPAKMDESIKKRIDAVNERRMKRREFVRTNKLPGSKLDLLSGGVFRRITGSSGKFVASFLENFNKLKLGKTLWVLGVAMEVGLSHLVEVEIDQMVEDEEITADEAKALRKWVTAQMWGSLIGGSVLGTLSGIGAGLLATATGGVLAPAVPLAVIGGSVYGSKTGQDIATVLVDLPKSLTDPASGNKPGGAHSAMSERREQNRKQGKPNATPEAKPQPNASNTSGNYVPGSDAEWVKNRAQREGVRLNPYASAEGGNPTIGMGHKLTDAEMKAGGVFIGGQLVKLDLSKLTARGGKETGPGQLTKQQVQQLAEEDHKRHEAQARTWIGADVFDKLTPDQQWALGDLSYSGGYSAFKDGQLIKMVRAGDHEGAANYISKWGLYYTAQSDIPGGPKKGEKVYNKHMARGTRGRAELYAGTKITDSGTRLATNNPPLTTTTAAAATNTDAVPSQTIPQAANIPPASTYTNTTEGLKQGIFASGEGLWDGMRSAAEKTRKKVSKIAESFDEKRRRMLFENISASLSSISAESLTSDLLEKLEMARTVMAGKPQTGGTTVINNDNSTVVSGSSGASVSKDVVPITTRNNVEHSTFMGM